jgi:hypothetical protein
MDPGIMAYIAIGVASGIEFLHNHCNLIHRDLKVGGGRKRRGKERSWKEEGGGGGRRRRRRGAERMMGWREEGGQGKERERAERMMGGRRARGSRGGCTKNFLHRNRSSLLPELKLGKEGEERRERGKGGNKGT